MQVLASPQSKVVAPLHAPAAQLPDLHASPTVHALPSLQVAPSPKFTAAQVPIVGLQLLTAQGLSPGTHPTTVAGLMLQTCDAWSQNSEPLHKLPSFCAAQSALF